MSSMAMFWRLARDARRGCMRAVNLMVLRTRAVLFAGFTFVVFTLRSDVARTGRRTKLPHGRIHD